MPVLRDDGIGDRLAQLKEDFPPLEDVPAAMQCIRTLVEELYIVDEMVMPCFPVTFVSQKNSSSSFPVASFFYIFFLPTVLHFWTTSCSTFTVW